jgi:regulator of replication initiation timing
MEYFIKESKELVSLHFDNLNDLMVNVYKLAEQLKDIKKFANLENPDTQLLQLKYDDIKQDLGDVREKVMENIFLSVFMQVILLDYVKNYSKEYLQSIEIFRNNIDLELHLCDKIQLYYKSLKLYMESVLK